MAVDLNVLSSEKTEIYKVKLIIHSSPTFIGTKMKTEIKKNY